MEDYFHNVAFQFNKTYKSLKELFMSLSCNTTSESADLIVKEEDSQFYKGKYIEYKHKYNELKAKYNLPKSPQKTNISNK
jgi:hypothetical protein